MKTTKKRYQATKNIIENSRRSKVKVTALANSKVGVQAQHIQGTGRKAKTKLKSIRKRKTIIPSINSSRKRSLKPGIKELI
jgi:SRSO17 transposase